MDASLTFRLHDGREILLGRVYFVGHYELFEYLCAHFDGGRAGMASC
ncbi:MAG: hypothetical protein QM778_10440 [Myxococcales bacterium]